MHRRRNRGEHWGPVPPQLLRIFVEAMDGLNEELGISIGGGKVRRNVLCVGMSVRM